MKILFTSSLDTSFIREDLRLLRKHFTVDHLMTRGWSAPFRIAGRILKADVTFTWFASVYAFVVIVIARLFNRRSLVVVGGVDAARYPEINYGIWLNPWKAPLVRYAMRHAHRLLVVDPFLRQEVIRLAAYRGENIEYVPTGYDAQQWRPEGQKEPFVLTVAACHDGDRVRKKGIDHLLTVAGQLPSMRFVVIGVSPRAGESLARSVPANVEIIPLVEQHDLLRYYQRARVYCQPSFTEGLPNSLCEAMLCECIPVGTNVGGIPTAVRGIGYLVEYGDTPGLARVLKEAMEAPAEVGKQARARIAAEFTTGRREEALVRILRGAVA